MVVYYFRFLIIRHALIFLTKKGGSIILPPMKKTGFPKREGMEKANPLFSVAFFKLFSFVTPFKRCFSSFMPLPSICTSKPLIKLRNVSKQSTIHFICFWFFYLCSVSLVSGLIPSRTCNINAYKVSFYPLFMRA